MRLCNAHDYVTEPHLFKMWSIYVETKVGGSGSVELSLLNKVDT